MVDIECTLCFNLQFFSATIGISVETLVGFRVKYLLLLSDSTVIRIRLQILVKLPSTKINENLFSVSRSARY
jgi:hypothetical protein